MKSLLLYVFSLLLITSCQNTNEITKKNIYPEGLWRISNHKGNIKTNEIFRYMSLNLSSYVLYESGNGEQKFEQKKSSPIKKIEISSSGKRKEFIQEIVFLFSPEYCVNFEELNNYNWSDRGSLKNVPVHVLNSPPASDGVFLQKVGHKFVLEQRNGLETTVRLGKSCAEKISVGRLWQPI